MPRRAAAQVTEAVSRLLAGGMIKSPPLWYAATLEHPTVPLPPRTGRKTPAQAEYLTRLEQGSSTGSSKHRRRASPSLKPEEMRQLEDRVLEQFYRDHPWEAKRPRSMIEPHDVISRPIGPPKGKGRELRQWGRNPGPAEVVAATMELHESHGQSLSTAYLNTIASYHALRAEHETATRYATLEASAHGAQFGPTETERSFRLEGIALQKHAEEIAAASADPLQPSAEARDAGVHSKTRHQAAYSGGSSYLRAART